MEARYLKDRTKKENEEATYHDHNKSICVGSELEAKKLCANVTIAMRYWHPFTDKAPQQALLLTPPAVDAWGTSGVLGRIINITSVVGLVGNAGQTNYCAAKAGVIVFTKSMAREYSSTGINVNAIAPGLIMTELTGDIQGDWMKKGVRENPLAMKKELPILGVFGSIFTTLSGLKASKAFFSKFTESIFGAPMLFFDSAPVGRILTRLASGVEGDTLKQLLRFLGHESIDQLLSESPSSKLLAEILSNPKIGEGGLDLSIVNDV
ncbi:3-oxoacyl-[acyl-carrier-protein] reductase 4-like protein [Tanacetum coccineum]